MIPRLRETTAVQARYLDFIEALKAGGFEGDLNPDYANRTVLATDNSIYQVLPQGVVYPRHHADLQRLAELSNSKPFADIVLSPRGGGTGTNGQSLTDGLVVDLSRHMNQILEINAQQRWVRVQTGVVKDQLNAALKPHGLFFAPDLSTSNRATIGGMINTDASGQGSCRYGKTRDHVLELRTVLLDGSEWTSRPLTGEELAAACERQDRAGLIHRLVDNIQKEHAGTIAATFPPLNRCLTGYDLAHIRDEQGRFDLNSILCGSEGTLGFITEAKLNVLPIPKCTALVNVLYRDFDTALRDATDLMTAQPTSIETVDSKVLGLAKRDIVWHSVAEFFPADGGGEIAGVNLVEYTADDEPTLQAEVQKLRDHLDGVQGRDGKSVGYTVAWGRAAVERIWGMRKKSVGLLGNTRGEARPIPFVEDTAVPPQHLADFIRDFRQILDSEGLEYGMFGHVDAGVLHVRPALDMKDPEQEKFIRPITDRVVALVQRYNGLLWGEHGKGVRSEYAPAFFGDLYPQLQRIKACFDPRNQLNPGKIASTGAHTELLKIDAVPTRGQQDRQIPAQVWDGYAEGVHCNGNGLCHNWNYDDPMCPSWKGTRERIHSPKGRASLMREWLRQLSRRGVDPVAEQRRLGTVSFRQTLLPRLRNSWRKLRGEYDFSHEVHNAMSGCLACKSCAGQCPIKVDVPEFRSKFLALYYSRYLRPLKDYFIGGLEFILPSLAKVPRLYNGLLRPRFMQQLLGATTGMVDSPLLSGVTLDQALPDMGIRYATPDALQSLSETEKQRAVIVVQDAFTSYFDTQVVIDLLQLLQKLDFVPLVTPFKPNGKPLHVHGFLARFADTARDNARMLNAVAASGVPLIGVDPSMTLTYRSEYRKLLGEEAPAVELMQEWLARQTQHLEQHRYLFQRGAYKLLGHCTEKTNAAPAMQAWQTVFEQLELELTQVETGCCGMAGTYGHEAANLATSKTIYAQSWGPAIAAGVGGERLMATGYSCRCQVKRIDGQQLPHPVQALLQATSGKLAGG
ncbi:FAD-binding oxidoreductase [Exilibacterium tricleocarpae]|uniref:D-2-hydroxyglutarate dehydrogenase n=1 Tax=Exilibacterium tricleocarpae TaxID=2591008 RepID=A0A545U5G6_9GAMM|nr:FAD-binding and (Fe-S)-binding domain-containing protein [Exilibacterium tricleocarpae]TQV84706.1 FAD-binding oxidoreductase [Exilibacterium tricleocarpae]